MNGMLDRIYSTFGEVAKTIGYSPIHGKIIAALIVNRGEMSLQKVAKETGYSVSMISISLDLLEMLGIIRKTRKPGDRNMYISLQGDLLEILKNAVVMRISKSINNMLTEIRENKEGMKRLPLEEREKIKRSVEMLEKEIKRLDRYVKILSTTRLP